MFGPSDMGETAFMREGWRRSKKGDALSPTESYATTMRAREAEFSFKTKEKTDEEVSWGT